MNANGSRQPNGDLPGADGLDFTSYDRSPTLTSGERKALDYWVTHHGALDHLAQSLPRLYQPLADVRQRMPPNQVGVKRAISLILHQVHLTQQMYWSWSDTRWLDLINSATRPHDASARPYLLVMAFLLSNFSLIHKIESNLYFSVIACRIFGDARFRVVWSQLYETLRELGYGAENLKQQLATVLGVLMLEARSARLDRFDAAVLERTCRLYHDGIARQISKISHGLAALGVLDRPLRMRHYVSWREKNVSGIHPDWVTVCQRWRETSTLVPSTRESNYSFILRVGLWLAEAHPDVKRPEDWTVDICADFVAAVDRLTVGEWQLASSSFNGGANAGKPLSANSKQCILYAMRRFFQDIQYWGWTTLQFSPRYHLATPNSIRRLSGVNPRTIDENVWLKLIWASLHLEPSDMLSDIHYPFELIKAVAVIWTHAGLRRNEIFRLRLGCAKSQSDDITLDSGETALAGTLCYLDVPAGKTFTAYTKPVSNVVREVAEAWEAVRPEQAPLVDMKTGERVRYLFQFRGRPVGKTLIDQTVIPILCQKAGVPREDSRGRITSHRARASTVTALASVPQGMSLVELMRWSGHTCPRSTMHYLRVKPTKLAASFAKADQMAHLIEVLIDHEAVVSGAAANGEPYKYYDLGDSYCTNPFWSTCPHRMACAGCDFNLPKASAEGAALAAKTAVQKCLEEVPLTPDEKAAMTGDLDKLNGLLTKLANIATPDGRTPKQIYSSAKR